MSEAPVTLSAQTICEAAAQLGGSSLQRVRLPNFVGIGSGRCGTSYLFALLASHPDFYLSPLKEVNYFGIRQQPFTRDGWTLADYRFCFASQGSQTHIGEITPVYMAQTVSLRQMQAQLGRIRVIATVRNPLDRFASHFAFHRPFHKHDDVDAYAEAALERYLPGYFRQDWHAPEKAIELSLYAPGIAAAIDLFGKDRVLVLHYEDLAVSERRWTEALSAFFATDLSRATAPPGARNASEGAEPGAIRADLRRRLADIFRADAARLGPLVGRDLVAAWSLDGPTP